MNRYKPYPQYKDSGVEWLGEVPEHWEIDALRRSLIEHKQGFYTTESYNDHGIKLLRITDLQESGKISYKKCPRVSIGNSDKSFLLKNGDFVFARTGGAGSFGYINQLNEDVIFASYLIRFRFSNIIIGNYLKYFFMSSSFINAIESNIHGGVNKNIHAEDIKNQYVTKPPKKEQQSIANFLDNATCKIDTLIQKQQNLIELLKEKRQALISHALTKGLNPHVKMKDSGVEWLGEVPEHWEIKALKFIAELNPKKSEILNKEEKDCSFVPMEKLKTGNIDLDLIKPVSDVYDGYTYFRNDDILLAKVTPCFENRNIAIAANLCNEIGFGSSEIYVIRAYKQSDKKYLFYSLQERTFIELAVSQMTGVGGLKRIPSEFLANLKFPFPSFSEQQEISNYLDNATYKIDTLITKAQKAIELLKERRIALISATVTGKIDVRKHFDTNNKTGVNAYD